MDGALPLTALLGPHVDRLRGIRDWDDLPHLGAANLQQIVAFAARALLDDQNDLDRQERADRIAARERLVSLQRSTSTWKPVLPRLRVESFRPGQPLEVLLADTPGARCTWGSVTVRSVTKSHNAAWSHHFPSRGWYWRVDAHADRPLFGDADALAFSTSEPRALPTRELAFLRRAVHEDPNFVRIYCENARRDWNPLWCDEASLHASGEALDLRTWLAVA